MENKKMNDNLTKQLSLVNWVFTVMVIIGQVYVLPLCAECVGHERKDTVVVDSTKLFIDYERMPEFPGGYEALNKFLADNVKYPKTEACVSGRTIVEFVVNKDGSLSDFRVIKSLGPDFDKEALRVLKLMPKWIPGKQKDKCVRVKYTIPIKFDLENYLDANQSYGMVQSEYSEIKNCFCENLDSFHRDLLMGKDDFSFILTPLAELELSDKYLLSDFRKNGLLVGFQKMNLFCDYMYEIRKPLVQMMNISMQNTHVTKNAKNKMSNIRLRRVVSHILEHLIKFV